ncbi:hypothetical protein [Kitasatospora sp. NPDC058046]|uniref:hypothetical protein n=1 Tax=Kitasatospora sp. NPDC058046 TaxID=3346312 RepID=UPI0036DD4C9E
MKKQYEHVVQFSAGIGSFASAVRVVRRHGPDRTTLLMADTQIEDFDSWRFAQDASRLLDVPLVRVADGRDPFQVFHDKKFLGNSRIAGCTKALKIDPCQRWLEKNADHERTTLYIGIDASARDRNRIPPIATNWQPWRTAFPLCEEGEPELTKNELLDEARSLGIEPPRLYGMGYTHNNCGGMCVRAGKSQWLRTLRLFHERYAIAETQEEEFRRANGDYAILKEQRNRVVYPLTLRELRLREEARQAASV